MTPEVVTLLVGAGLLAGFINTIAGGGSLLTIPALAMTGLGWDVANGSNRLAALSQGLVASTAFHRAGRLDIRDAMGLALPVIGGATIGALVATWIDPAALEGIILAMLIAVGVLMALKPKLIMPQPDAPALSLSERPMAGLWLFAAGAYGGFLQAGVGYFLLAVLAGVLRRDLVGANALKVLLVSLFTVVALAIFIANDRVAWGPGLVVAGASAVGSWLGVRFALRVPQAVLRWAIVATLTVTAVAVALR